MSSDPASIRRLYGRRTGHKLRMGQAALVKELLPRLAVPEAGPLSAAGLFGNDRPLWLEIGFGRGEHMAAQAAANPEVGIIGAEPFIDGVVGDHNRRHSKMIELERPPLKPLPPTINLLRLLEGK